MTLSRHGIHALMGLPTISAAVLGDQASRIRWVRSDGRRASRARMTIAICGGPRVRARMTIAICGGRA